MENASKALLIAGAILVAILLIAMGVRVFNSTQGTTEAAQSTMKSAEVAMFNNKFLPYIGKNKTVKDAIAFLNMVLANNASGGRKITIKVRIANVPGMSTYDLSATQEISKISEAIEKLYQYSGNLVCAINVSGARKNAQGVWIDRI